MPHNYIFADEAGCFTFRNKSGASKYFIVCTLSTSDCAISNDLLQLRRDLWESGHPEIDKLHATADRQATRDKVFGLIEAQKNFRIDATIIEKARTPPELRRSEPDFYRHAWHCHFESVLPGLLAYGGKKLIHTAALGDKKTRAAFKLAVNNAIQPFAPRDRWESLFLESAKDPMLWAADYCAWAIQRKWELGDSRSFEIIAKHVSTENEVWKETSQIYY